MKVLQSAQNYLAMMGIRQNQSLANVNFFLAEFLFFTNVASNVLFLIYDANTFREYTTAIFMISTFTMVAVCFTLFAKESGRTFKMIDLGEELLKKSEKIL